MPGPCWVDGRIVAGLGAHDAAPAAGAACYSTGRWTGAAIRFETRHVERLLRDAAALGIGPVDPGTALRAFRELGRAAFADASGVVRVEARAGAPGRVHLVGTVRPLGAEPRVLRAVTLPFACGGAGPACGAKRAQRPVHDRGAGYASRAGVEEGLLFDRAGRLVEGTHTNLVFVEADGRPCAPPAERGAVAGVALEIASEGLPGLSRRDCTRERLAGLHELVALNAVRGAVPVVEIDGRPVGDGRPGPLSRRLAAVLDAAS